jgi:hypothetical protein
MPQANSRRHKEPQQITVNSGQQFSFFIQNTDAVAAGLAPSVAYKYQTDSPTGPAKELKSRLSEYKVRLRQSLPTTNTAAAGAHL